MARNAAEGCVVTHLLFTPMKGGRTSAVVFQRSVARTLPGTPILWIGFRRFCLAHVQGLGDVDVPRKSLTPSRCVRDWAHGSVQPPSGARGDGQLSARIA